MAEGHPRVESSHNRHGFSSDGFAECRWLWGFPASLYNRRLASGWVAVPRSPFAVDRWRGVGQCPVVCWRIRVAWTRR